MTIIHIGPHIRKYKCRVELVATFTTTVWADSPSTAAREAAVKWERDRGMWEEDTADICCDPAECREVS